MPDNNVLDMIQYAVDNKPVDFTTTFNSLMSQKVIDAIDAKRQEIATTIFDSHPDVSDEELDQAIDDIDQSDEIEDFEDVEIDDIEFDDEEDFDDTDSDNDDTEEESDEEY